MVRVAAPEQVEKSEKDSHNGNGSAPIQALKPEKESPKGNGAKPMIYEKEDVEYGDGMVVKVQ